MPDSVGTIKLQSHKFLISEDYQMQGKKVRNFKGESVLEYNMFRFHTRHVFQSNTTNLLYKIMPLS